MTIRERLSLYWALLGLIWPMIAVMSSDDYFAQREIVAEVDRIHAKLGHSA